MKNISTCTICIAIVLHAAAGPTDTTRYSILTSGLLSGKQLAWQENKNDHHYYYEFNDRGRGPSITQAITTDDAGIVIKEEITGVDYYKTPVNEIFYTKDNKAFWKNKFENDSAVFSNQTYSDINGTPASSELLLSMLRSSSTKKLDVLPAGTRNFEEIIEKEISNGQQKQQVQLIAFSGFGGAPQYSWFTKEGIFFASLSDWSSIILQGFEKNTDELIMIQKKYEQLFYNNLAKKITQKNANGIAIKNVSVFNSKTGILSLNNTVLIKAGKIERLGTVSSVAVPSSYKIIDGTGKFLMPGLWEMHGHFDQGSGPFMLAQGVTNLRDMGNGPSLLTVRKQIKKDSILGPDISYISGFIDQAGPYAGPTGAIIHSLDEGLKAIDDYKMKGYDQIKLYSSIKPEWVKPLAAKAHSLGMRVCGHIPSHMTASQAIDAGYNEVTHINMIMLNFFGDTVETRNMNRFKLVGQKGYMIDLNGSGAQALIKKMKDKNVAHDPTITTFEDMFIGLPGKPSEVYRPILAYLPAEVKRFAMSGGFIGDDSEVESYRKSYDAMKKMVKKLYDNKIIVVAGTDGGIVQHELETYADCGIPNADVLKMATIIPAKLTGRDNLYGSIEPGKIANLILVDGNPLENMQDIRKVFMTIKEGKLYSPRDIYTAYGWKYYY
ncbi:MAG: amidohydrolase family protein [Bacteroidetes bacterium]|nr:amidohydrolase family protein [Bacteroidota bacterium]